MKKFCGLICALLYTSSASSMEIKPKLLAMIGTQTNKKRTFYFDSQNKWCHEIINDSTQSNQDVYVYNLQNGKRTFMGKGLPTTTSILCAGHTKNGAPTMLLKDNQSGKYSIKIFGNKNNKEIKINNYTDFSLINFAFKTKRAALKITKLQSCGADYGESEDTFITFFDIAQKKNISEFMLEPDNLSESFFDRKEKLFYCTLYDFIYSNGINKRRYKHMCYNIEKNMTTDLSKDTYDVIKLQETSNFPLEYRIKKDKKNIVISKNAHKVTLISPKDLSHSPSLFFCNKGSHYVAKYNNSLYVFTVPAGAFMNSIRSNFADLIFCFEK